MCKVRIESEFHNLIYNDEKIQIIFILPNIAGVFFIYLYYKFVHFYMFLNYTTDDGCWLFLPNFLLHLFILIKILELESAMMYVWLDVKNILILAYLTK